MNKKIKIIELFQKYANYEELPKKITYKKQVFNLYNDSLYATDKECLDRFMDYINYDFSNLNDYVEVLEDNTEEIEEIYVDDNNFIHTELGSFKGRKMDIAFVNKFNEISKAINKLRKEKE